MEATIHAFERAGLGQAPYRFAGFERKVGPICTALQDGTTLMVGAPGQPMSSCDFCSTGIADEFWLVSADGKRFKVGSDCIHRAGDKGLKRAIAPVKREHSHQRDDARIAAARELLDSVREALDSQPHPYKYMADKGHTLLGFVEWNLQNAGRSGKIAAARQIERAAKS